MMFILFLVLLGAAGVTGAVYCSWQAYQCFERMDRVFDTAEKRHNEFIARMDEQRKACRMRGI